MKEKRIAFGTLGCRLNQFESDSLVSGFVKNGYEIVSINDKADVYIVNTCSVTNKSDAKSRNLLHRVHRLNPDALLFVTGCYAETESETVKNIDGVNFVIGNDKKYDLFNIVHRTLSHSPVDIKKVPSNRFHYEPAENTLHTRSYLKIQDGCDEHCSYCKIPRARGRGESRPSRDIIHTTQHLIDFGYKEIMLTGINIGDYMDEETNLSSLLKTLLAISGDFRIHLSSLEPNKVTPSILDLLSHPKICPHLHLPLQSGSDRILGLMGRGYDRKDYLNVVKSLRERLPMINITTDVMVGFPSESEEDFMQTLTLVEDLSITHTHTFKYSMRDGTPASKLKDQIPEFIKSERSLRIRQLSEGLNQTYREGFKDRFVRVLTEKALGEGIYAGYTDHYIRVQFMARNPVIGEFKKLKIMDVTKEKTWAC
ncbi:MAG: tRNA (N(6)-L-threonylcarbamoyladenosine(37)-C(2))-methylthiotransferase MtaB [bacterium]|nr:MAG: tRNA (N(6)-L-threonylcarbamoyladenosine(37)-C(2))-methylthiotransferase MtaB [bacterium]